MTGSRKQLDGHIDFAGCTSAPDASRCVGACKVDIQDGTCLRTRPAGADACACIRCKMWSSGADGRTLGAAIPAAQVGSYESIMICTNADMQRLHVACRWHVCMFSGCRHAARSHELRGTQAASAAASTHM